MNVVQNALWKLLNPIAIVTGSHDGKMSGFIASWVTQVSFIPPLIMVATNPKHYTYELIAQSNAFAVNILRTDQSDLVDWFGKRSGKRVAKFESTPHEPGKTGSPLLKDCLACIECNVMWTKEAGDHVIVVGKIVDAIVKSDGDVLRESRSMYAHSGSR